MALTHLLSVQSTAPGQLGQALRPRVGESVCGDQIGGWFGADGGLRLALADGLGHGVEAHAAAVAAMSQLAASVGLPLVATIAHCDAALRTSRGVALAVVEVIPGAAGILHVAVGNVRTLLLQPGGVRRLSGARGIIGAGYGHLRAEFLPLARGDWLVMFSDGIGEGAAIAGDLQHETPSDALAERLLARWARDDDDASLLLYRHG